MTHRQLHRMLFPTILVACGAFVLSASLCPAQDTQATQPEATPAEELPEAKALIEEAMKAMGGEEAMKKIKSLQSTAEMDNPMGGSMILRTFWKGPDQAKFVQEVPMPQLGENMVNTMAANGGIGWRHNSMQGGTQLLSKREADGIVEQCRMHLMLPTEQKRMSEQGRTIELTDFGGEKVYKIQVPLYEAAETENNPAERHIYIAKETRLPVGVSMSQMGSTVSMRFEDWEEIDGVKFFRKIVIDQAGMEMELRYTELTVNSVDETVFEIPSDIKKQAEQRDAAEPEPTNEPASQPGA